MACNSVLDLFSLKVGSYHAVIMTAFGYSMYYRRCANPETSATRDAPINIVGLATVALSDNRLLYELYHAIYLKKG